MLLGMVVVRIAWMASVVVAVGCGPTVGTGAETDASSSAAADSTSTSSTPTTVDPTIGSDVDPTIDPSTSTTTSTTSDDDDSSSGGGTFITRPDWGTACTTFSVCDIWAQDCPEGEKCVPWSADGDGDLDDCFFPRCSALDPDPLPTGSTCSMPGGPWSGEDACEIGAFCWDVDPATNEGTCVANCMGSEANPTCADDLRCFQGFDGWITACVPGCAPLQPACAEGETCVTTQFDPAVCLPASLPLPAAQGEPCDEGCGSGFACMPVDLVAGCADVGSCCTAVCDPKAPVCDVDVPVCVPLEGNAPAGACTIG